MEFLPYGIGFGIFIVGCVIYSIIYEKKISSNRSSWLVPQKRIKEVISLWFAGQKPLNIHNYNMIVRKEIRNKLYKDINNRLYTNHIIGNEVATHIDFVIRNENFLPMGFEESFHCLFKEEIAGVIKDYSSSGRYDVSLESYDDRIHLLIIPKITNVLKK